MTAGVEISEACKYGRLEWACAGKTTYGAREDHELDLLTEKSYKPGLRQTQGIPDQAVGFVEGYGRTWENWDFDGFVDLFTDDVVYVEHPTDETVIGREQMHAYIRAEYDDQGVATVQMGSPIVQGCQVVAEFWARMTKAEHERTLIGCFIARLDPTDGRCSHFRQYWFVTPGHASPFADWGSD